MFDNKVNLDAVNKFITSVLEFRMKLGKLDTERFMGMTFDTANAMFFVDEDGIPDVNFGPETKD